MRPPRLVLLLASLIAFTLLFSFLSVLTSHTQRGLGTASNDHNRHGRVRALSSFFRAPSSLFPPSAIISLTDDNSTFFLARPAAFGPLLPSRGLSGRLWVGSGFGDDELRRGGISSGVEGELGCSDVPGWHEGNTKSNGDMKLNSPLKQKASSSQVDGSPPDRKRSSKVSDFDGQDRQSAENDGTDDHLHHPLPDSESSVSEGPGQIAQHESLVEKKKRPLHADIQSLQEAAEISGKIVLLSRGGCGFLEKVKWVQRRGGIALIVGDNVKGSGLVTMYARGDTSNVTIPSLFTSHTTAHLLSSLIPPNSFIDDMKSTKPEKMSFGDSTMKSDSRWKGTNNNANKDGTTFTPTTRLPRPTSNARSSARTEKQRSVSATSNALFKPKESRGWFRSLLAAFGLTHNSMTSTGILADSRRPPTSGHLDWVLLDDWDGEDPKASKKVKASGKDVSAVKNAASKVGNPSSSERVADDFVIGVQDWRDPDVLEFKTSSSSKLSNQGDTNSFLFDEKSSSVKGEQIPTDRASGAGKSQHGHTTFQGGSITPGSGEYENPQAHPKVSIESSGSSSANAASAGDESRSSRLDDGWFGHLFGADDDASDGASLRTEPSQRHSYIPGNRGNDLSDSSQKSDYDDDADDFEVHDGLWVTMTPTSISTSPIFDTLLVLVVSPLVTLTIVYALLLVRSRIRRRRWRAPKSVVDRLPVRTYHTVPYSSSTSTPSMAASRSSSPSLYLSDSNRSRPRSRTTTGIVVSTQAVPNNLTVPVRQGIEKLNSASSPWKRKYACRQVECAVCLEEYIDGHSQIMILPCGHEFHADCITPWLTTRRRTCPICKGDVVRSMASNSETEDQRQRQENTEYGSPSQITISQTESASATTSFLHAIDEDLSELERGENNSETESSTFMNVRQHWHHNLIDSLSALRRQILRPSNQADEDR